MINFQHLPGYLPCPRHISSHGAHFIWAGARERGLSPIPHWWLLGWCTPVHTTNINNHAWIPSTLCNKSDPPCKHLLQDNVHHCSKVQDLSPISNYGKRFDECQSTTWALWAHTKQVKCGKFHSILSFNEEVMGHWTITCPLKVKFVKNILQKLLLYSSGILSLPTI